MDSSLNETTETDFNFTLLDDRVNTSSIIDLENNNINKNKKKITLTTLLIITKQPFVRITETDKP